jgi:hypothetical protein
MLRPKLPCTRSNRIRQRLVLPFRKLRVLNRIGIEIASVTDGSISGFDLQREIVHRLRVRGQRGGADVQYVSRLLLGGKAEPNERTDFEVPNARRRFVCQGDFPRRIDYLQRQIETRRPAIARAQNFMRRDYAPQRLN